MILADGVWAMCSFRMTATAGPFTSASPSSLTPRSHMKCHYLRDFLPFFFALEFVSVNRITRFQHRRTYFVVLAALEDPRKPDGTPISCSNLACMAADDSLEGIIGLALFGEFLRSTFAGHDKASPCPSFPTSVMRDPSGSQLALRVE